jgi:hypothetical protein
VCKLRSQMTMIVRLYVMANYLSEHANFQAKADDTGRGVATVQPRAAVTLVASHTWSAESETGPLCDSCQLGGGTAIVFEIQRPRPSFSISTYVREAPV